MIPEPVKWGYDLLREDPTWYLRKELIKDCAARNGCCSRSCGCCEKRQFTTERRKGIGHCTPECECCSTDRGFEFTTEEKREIERKLRTMLISKNAAFLLRMAHAYFSEPGLFELLKNGSKSLKTETPTKMKWWGALFRCLFCSLGREGNEERKDDTRSKRLYLFGAWTWLEFNLLLGFTGYTYWTMCC